MGEIEEELKNLNNLDNEILEDIGEWRSYSPENMKDWYYYVTRSWFVDDAHYEYGIHYHIYGQPIISIPATTMCDDFAERITDLSIKYGIALEDHRIWLEDGYVGIDEI